MTQKIEALRAIVGNEAIAQTKRDEAAKVLAELERSDPFAYTMAAVKLQYAAYVEQQNRDFKVCGSCHRKQVMDADICDLCGASQWELAVVESTDGRRNRFIAAATTYSDERLAWYIEHTSMDVGFAAHCARILELRSVKRPTSFWERAGFMFSGARLAT